MKTTGKRITIGMGAVSAAVLVCAGFSFRNDLIEWWISREDDSPEINAFCGLQLVGDVIIYVVDHSRPVWGSSQIKRVKSELYKNIGQISEAVSFAIIFFDGDILAFPSSEQLACANPQTKSAAIQFIESVQVGGDGNHHFQEALETGIRLAKQKSWHRKVLACVTGGDGPDMPGELDRIRAAICERNQRRVAIHTICLLPAPEEKQLFLELLAAMNRGTSVRIPPLVEQQDGRR